MAFDFGDIGKKLADAAKDAAKDVAAAAKDKAKEAYDQNFGTQQPGQTPFRAQTPPAQPSRPVAPVPPPATPQPPPAAPAPQPAASSIPSAPVAPPVMAFKVPLPPGPPSWPNRPELFAHGTASISQRGNMPLKLDKSRGPVQSSWVWDDLALVRTGYVLDLRKMPGHGHHLWSDTQRR